MSSKKKEPPKGGPKAKKACRRKVSPKPSTSSATDRDSRVTRDEVQSRPGASNDAKKTGFFDETKRGRGHVKHAILKRYLQAFFPILCQSRKRLNKVMFVDGFAGTGTYAKYEDGSPLVAYNLLIEHNLLDRFDIPVELVFIEKGKVNADKLNEALSEAEQGAPNEFKDKVSFVVYNQDFQGRMNMILDDEDENTFLLVFADPFGYKVPMELFKKILGRRNSEIFINVMYFYACRWFPDPSKEKTLEEWLGSKSEQWKKDIGSGRESDLKSPQKAMAPEKKRDLFYRHYLANLMEGNPDSFHLKFKMKSHKNAEIYGLVFVSSHIKGLQEMKRSMVKKSQKSDELVFSEWVEGLRKEKQPEKMEKEEIVEDLKGRILESFAGRKATGSCLENYVWLQTPYIFNVAVKLRKEFEEFATTKNRKFAEIEYDFSTI